MLFSKKNFWFKLWFDYYFLIVCIKSNKILLNMCKKEDFFFWLLQFLSIKCNFILHQHIHYTRYYMKHIFSFHQQIHHRMHILVLRMNFYCFLYKLDKFMYYHKWHTYNYTNSIRFTLQLKKKFIAVTRYCTTSKYR